MSIVSIVAILIIILLVLQSVSLPAILVVVIEFAIFINMGIPFYTGQTLPFIASVVIGTIQLGATVDYAILMTTRYKRERSRGAGKRRQWKRLSGLPYSRLLSVRWASLRQLWRRCVLNIDMISALCTLMARGAIVSMLVVIFVLPAMFMLFDKLICKTSRGFLPKKQGVTVK